jgi:predicted phage tail protein
MQIRGLKGFLMMSHRNGLVYAVFAGKRNLTRQELNMPCGDEDIRIAPIIQGSSKGGLFGIILGAVLVVAGIVFENPQLVYMGAALALGGVAQMLTPTPKGLSSGDTGASKASYNFNGPVNTVAQGNPVPLLYGRMIVGSAVISGSVYAEDQT